MVQAHKTKRRRRTPDLVNRTLMAGPKRGNSIHPEDEQIHNPVTIPMLHRDLDMSRHQDRRQRFDPQYSTEHLHIVLTLL
jgi:hypothetical protein